jgi:hypothetical protein
MTSEDVINRLAGLFIIYGVPEHIRRDNHRQRDPAVSGLTEFEDTIL